MKNLLAVVDISQGSCLRVTDARTQEYCEKSFQSTSIFVGALIFSLMDTSTSGRRLPDLASDLFGLTLPEVVNVAPTRTWICPPAYLGICISSSLQVSRPRPCSSHLWHQDTLTCVEAPQPHHARFTSPLFFFSISSVVVWIVPIFYKKTQNLHRFDSPFSFYAIWEINYDIRHIYLLCKRYSLHWKV